MKDKRIGCDCGCGFLEVSYDEIGFYLNSRKWYFKKKFYADVILNKQAVEELILLLQNSLAVIKMQPEEYGICAYCGNFCNHLKQHLKEKHGHYEL